MANSSSRGPVPLTIAVMAILSFAAAATPVAYGENPLPGQTGGSPSDTAAAVATEAQKQDGDGDSTKDSRELFRSLLEESKAAIAKLSRYTATLEKQERIDGVLQEPSEILIKVRHEPFSVYMKCGDGKEVLYVDGQYENKLLARATKGLAALKGVWKVQPDSPVAMKDSRYPVTEAGLKEMTDRVIKYYDAADADVKCHCTHRTEVQDGRPVIIVSLAFASQKDSQYSNCTYFFDAESKIMYGIELCEWDYQGAPAGIAEKFIYHDINEKGCLGELEFDAENPEYSLADRR